MTDTPKYEADGNRVWMYAQVRLPGQGNKATFPARVMICQLPEEGGPLTAQQIADALNVADPMNVEYPAAAKKATPSTGSEQ